MSTGAIIAIVVVIALILIALLVALPRLRAQAEERKLHEKRSEVADVHREEAALRESKAEQAERAARRARTEADLHTERAELHERGLADDDLRDEDGNLIDRVDPGDAIERDRDRR